MWCLTLIISVSLRTISCPEHPDITYPIAIPKKDENIHLGEHNIRSILYKPKAYYNNSLPLTIIGDYVICLDIPNADSCLHGWQDTSVLGKRVSAECYRLSKQDMKTLWFTVTEKTKVLITD